MSQVAISGNASGTGTLTIAAPNTNSNYTLTLPTQTGTVMANGPAFSAYGNASQTIANNTTTKVQINTERFDTASCFDSTTNYRFTPTVAGYYQINGNVSFGNGVNNTGVYLLLYKTGTTISTASGNASTNTYASPTISTLVQMNGSTDYLELYVLQVTGSSIPINATVIATGDGINFSGSMVRGA